MFYNWYYFKPGEAGTLDGHELFMFVWQNTHIFIFETYNVAWERSIFHSYNHPD